MYAAPCMTCMPNESAIEDLQYFYESTVSVNRIDKALTLSFRIHLSAEDYTNFHVYELHTVHIPVPNKEVSTLATIKITNVTKVNPEIPK